MVTELLLIFFNQQEETRDATILSTLYGHTGGWKTQLHAFKTLELDDIQPDLRYSCYIRYCEDLNPPYDIIKIDMVA
jgi:hypothetical protein